MPALDRYDLGLLFGCAVYLYVNLFANPETPYLLGGDQVFFWMDAQRMLHGEQIYRDFFQFTPPGADLLYLGVFKLFGPRIWTPNLVVLLLGIALSLLCLRISRSILPRPESALATLLYLVFVIGLTLDGTHHWFSLLAVLGAAALLIEARSSLRVALAGALLGLATFFTQTRGPVAALGIAAWMTWERFRRDEAWSRYARHQVLLFAALILTWGALSSYYIATLGLRQLWFYQVDYVLQYTVAGWNAASIGLPLGRSWSSLGALVRWLFAYVLLPSVYAISLWRCARISREEFAATASRVALLTAVGAALWVEVAQSPSWFRFFCVSMPGVILLIWLVPAATQVSGYLTRSLWIGVIALAAYQTWSKHRIYTAVAELPAGRIATTPLAAEKLGWLAAHTKPGEFMFQAEWPGMYLPLDLRNPVYLDAVAGSSVAYVAWSIRQLEEKHVEFIVESPAYALPAFRAFLMNRYRLIWRFSDRDEVWQRETAAAAPAGQPL
jgi:hypothetical protein